MNITTAGSCHGTWDTTVHHTISVVHSSVHATGDLEPLTFKLSSTTELLLYNEKALLDPNVSCFDQTIPRKRISLVFGDLTCDHQNPESPSCDDHARCDF